ncbi:hypothetical protein PROFUN_02261 [Planoprotostelium fungivorum]|uniref:Uncharacterized protein n=1 Tax=Planoprotostelium fungivorum TaxID=1890364 RepID=A0A2P6NYE8_9EUKA|nr:hypothetical protein PROFUN_02261 [Planoprotostelium fungivorum]
MAIILLITRSPETESLDQVTSYFRKKDHSLRKEIPSHLDEPSVSEWRNARSEEEGLKQLVVRQIIFCSTHRGTSQQQLHSHNNHGLGSSLRHKSQRPNAFLHKLSSDQEHMGLDLF